MQDILLDVNPNTISVNPRRFILRVPPTIWKGDPTGHIGKHDVFFYVLEGEVILFVDSRYYTVKAGQMAFLPRGKMRKYTQVSNQFRMYEAQFYAEINGENLMSALGVNENNLVINVPDNEKMAELFVSSSHTELNKDTIYDVMASYNILNIIKIYVETLRNKLALPERDMEIFENMINYMQENLDKPITIDELSKITHIESTYLIRKFKKAYGIPPLSYFSNIRYHKAVEMLISTNESIENIAKSVGINDVAYFSRWFRKNCDMSPTEYRKLFLR